MRSNINVHSQEDFPMYHTCIAYNVSYLYRKAKSKYSKFGLNLL